MPSSPSDISRNVIETLVGEPVDDLTLYRRALTHRSYLRGDMDHHLQSNERLEFLGDALIDLAIGEVLYRRYPEQDEGRLTRLRARLVSKAPLARYARAMELGAHVCMSEGMESQNGRDNPSILADAFEALTGAVYLDKGYDSAQRFLTLRILETFDIEKFAAKDPDYKSRFQERMQAAKQPLPTYRVVQEEGADQDKTFTVEAMVGDTVYAQGTGGSKQEAEQQAARRTLETMRSPESAS